LHSPVKTRARAPVAKAPQDRPGPRYEVSPARNRGNPDTVARGPVLQFHDTGRIIMTAQAHHTFKQADDPAAKANGKAAGTVDKRPRKAAKTAKLPRKVYDAELRKLQVELCHMQEWVKKTGTRVIVILEGR